MFAMIAIRQAIEDTDMAIPFKPVRAVLLCVATAGIAACAVAGPADPPPKDAQLTLTQSQSVLVAPAVTLSFESVNDSRCPKNVMCVVAGRIVYHFTLLGDQVSDSFDLSESDPRYVSSKFKDLAIALDPSAPPPPLPIAHQSPPPYSVGLHVSSN